MNRRTCLRRLGLGSVALTAGCLAGESGPGTDPADTPTGTPPDAETETGDGSNGATAATDAAGTTDAAGSTVTPPAVTTPAPGECEAQAPPSPDPPEGYPEPRGYPDKPESMALEDVRPFLEAYESAHRYNSVLADWIGTDACVEYVDIWDVGSTLTLTADGVTGTVTTQASVQEVSCETVTGTDTPTPYPHGDLFHEEAHYYVTDRFLIREGTVLECWG